MTTHQSSRPVCETRPSPTPTESQLGPWRLGRMIGEGEFCQVFQAAPIDGTQNSSADYAIKRLRTEHADDPLAINMLRREANICRQISHPHLMCVLSSHLEQSRKFLVMPYQHGVAARELLRLPSTIRIAESLWFVRQTAEALAALHAAGWLHGDIKPDNLLVSKNGHVTLCDLGFGREIKSDAGANRDAVYGTVAYLAPELFADSPTTTGASDVYSLGVTLFEMLTGRRPFIHEDSAELGAAHRLLAPPDPRRLCPHLSACVSRLVRQMLSKEPLRRPTAVELIQRLVDLEIDELVNLAT